jgi:RNA recognition motif-containing protein
MKIFVGNLAWAATEQDVKQLFTAYGPVDSVKLCFYEEGHRRGFCFVEMIEAENALKAIFGLDGKEFMGRKLAVQKALSKEEHRG